MNARKMPIAVWFIGAIIGITLLVLGVYSFFTFRYSSDELISTLKNSTAVKADQLRETLALPVWNVDYEQINRVILSAMTEKQLFAVEISIQGDQNGDLYWSRNSNGEIVRTPVEYEGSGFVVENRSITQLNQEIGKIKIVATTQYFEADLKSRLSWQFTFTVATAVVLIVCIYLLLLEIVIKPLNRVESFANVVINEGNLNAEVKNAGFSGEIRELSIAITKMMEIIRGQLKDVKNSEDKTRTIFNLSFEFLGLLTPEGIVEDINQTALDFIGVSKNAVLNKYFWDAPWFAHAPESQEFIRQAIAKAVQGEMVRGTLLIKAKLEDHHIMDFTLKPIMNADGDVIQLIPEGHDITELKRAEEELQVLNDELEEKITQRTSQLETLNLNLMVEIEERRKVEKALHQAKELAEDANQAKSSFLANMSHEIRTPINAIIGLNHLIKKTELTDKQKEYVDKSQFSANALLSVVNNILDYSKIEAQKVTLEQIPFDLYEVLNNASEVISFKAFEKNLKVVLDVKPEVSRNVIGDPVKLSQVLINLMNNSIKFTEKGEISVLVKPINIENQEVLLQFTVKDTGVGISEKNLPILFKSFEQGDMSTTRKYGGTGLGLSISKGLVELMGGDIRCESEYGKGASVIFTVQLGLGESEITRIEESTETEKLAILFICDNSRNRAELAASLGSFGFEVNEVNSDEGAIKTLLSRKNYDLVFVDYELNTISGVQLVDSLAQSIAFEVAPIVLVSSFRSMELQALAEKSIIRKIVYYPLGQSQLYNAIIESRELKLPRKNKAEEIESVKFPYEGVVVLVVEDNEINQFVAKGILEDVGIAVDLAEDGEVALRKSLGKTYDLILMDIQMPIMDGYETTRRLRAIDATSKTPIIAMTA